jgi:hypothetical protein
MEKRELASDQNAHTRVWQQVESMCKEIRRACQGNQVAMEVIEREMKRFGNTMGSRQQSPQKIVISASSKKVVAQRKTQVVPLLQMDKVRGIQAVDSLQLTNYSLLKDLNKQKTTIGVIPPESPKAASDSASVNKAVMHSENSLH